MRDRFAFPSKWISASIKDIVDPSRAITYGIVQPGPRFDRDHGIPIIRGQDYSSGTVRSDDLYCVDPRLATSYSRASVQTGDLLISIVGYVGTVAEVPVELAGANLTQTTARIAVRDDLKGRYFLHFLRSHYFKNEVSRFTKGSAQPGLNLADVEVMRVSYPPDASERAAIAEVLDTLDTTIRQTEAIIAKLKQVKQGLLHDLLTRGIAANGELRPPQSEAPHLYKASPLGWIPVDWATTRLGDLLKVQLGFAFRSEDYVESGLLNFRVANIGRGETALGSTAYLPEHFWDTFPGQQLIGGEIVIVMVGATTGKLGRVPYELCPALQNQNMWNLVPLTGVNREFLWHLLPGAVARHLALAQGSARDFLTQAAFLSTECFRPTPAEQDRIVSMLNELDVDIRANDSYVGKLRLLKSGLMDDLLTGRVRVTPLLAQAQATQP
jgi:type I restriction enzyme, S subunit